MQKSCRTRWCHPRPWHPRRASWEYKATFPVAPPPAPPREPQVRAPSRTRCREGTTVTEDAARSAPARSPAPSVLCGDVPHAAVSSHSNRHPDERSPAPPGLRSPHTRLTTRRCNHACRQQPTRHATPWPTRPVPPCRNTLRRLRSLLHIQGVHVSVSGRDSLRGDAPVPWHNACKGREGEPESPRDIRTISTAS